MALDQKVQLEIDTTINAASTAKSLAELKQSLRDLQSLAIQVGEDSPEAFQRITAAAAQARDTIDDTRQSIAAVTGEPLEVVANGIGNISTSLSGLDFGRAANGITAVANGIKNIDFANVASQIASVGKSIIALTKALLSNPYVLIAAAIILIVTNFDKLLKIAGPIGAAFKALYKIILLLKDLFDDFTDSLGLTTVKLDKYDDAIKRSTEANDKLYDSIISVNEAAGKSDFTSVIKIQKLEEDLKTAETLLDDFNRKHVRDFSKLDITGQEIFDNDELNKEKKERVDAVNDLYTQLKSSQVKFKQDIKTLNVDTQDQQNKANIAGVKDLQKSEELKEELTYSSLVKRNNITLDLYKEQLTQLDSTIVDATKKVDLQTINSAQETKSKIQLEISKTNASIQEAAENLNKNLKAIRSKYEQERIQNDINSSKERYDNYNKDLEKQYSQGNITTERYLQIKQDLLIKSTDEEKQLTIKLYDEQIKALEYKNSITGKIEIANDSKYKSLLNSKAQYVISTNSTIDKSTNDSLQSILKNREDALHEEERIAKERISVEKGVRDAIIETAQTQLDIDNSELARLNQGAEKFKLNAKEKIDIITESAHQQLIILGQQQANEIAAAEGNEAKLTDIQNNYAEKRKKVAADEKDAKIAANEETINKIVSLEQYGFQAASDLSAAADNMDEAKRDKDGKLSLDLQKKKFNRNKGLQYANAIMNTAAGVTSALAEENYPGAIAIGVAGLAQIAKISSTQFKPESSSSSSSSSSASTDIQAPSVAVAPSSPFLNQQSLNQINPNVNGYGNGNGSGGYQRVYVVADDMTNVQNKVAVQQSRSTLSGI